MAGLVALLAALGADRPVHLVGNSYGGPVALHGQRLRQTIGELLSATTLLDDLWELTPISGPALTAARCPVLAVYGEHSGHLPAGRFRARCLPDCPPAVLPGLTRFCPDVARLPG